MSLRIAQLHAENIKRLQVVEVTPEGNIVEIAGNNGEGKSSLLDAIWIALKGRAAAPPEPIRQGEEFALIELDLGKLRIVRTFKRADDGDYTDTLRVEDPQGLKYDKPQKVLDALIGAIGFDPFAFVQMKSDAQAKQLLALVPLTDEAGQPVDLAELAALDKRIYDTRRDVNRDLKAAEARLDAIAPGEKVDVPNVEELQATIAEANDHNGSIERRKANREAFLEKLGADRAKLEEDRDRIAALAKIADDLEADIAARQKQIEDAEALPEPIDTAALFQQLATADQARQKNRLLEEREKVAAEVKDLRAKSEGHTKRLEENAALRLGALTRAKMPVEGLGVDFDDDGAHVTFNDVPFVQISTAEQLRVSTAIAMAANPELRVLRISDGALLDDNSMKLLGDMAREHDFQLWIELVKPNETTGIVLENGAIVGQDAKPRERKKPAARNQDDSTEKAARDALVTGTGATQGGEHVPTDELFQAPTYTQEEWDALSPARRAFLTKQGAGPATEGNDDNG